MSELDMPAQLLKVSEDVVRALASVATAAGPETGAQAATILIRIGVHHILHTLGAQPARDALAGTWSDLGEAIAASEPVITPVAVI
jgi:hypothetical protein